MHILHVSPTYYSTASVVGGGEKYVLYMMRAIAEGARHAGTDAENALLAFGKHPGRHALAGGMDCEIMAGTPWDPLSVSPRELLARIADFDVVVVHQCLTAFGLFVASHARLAGRIVVGMDQGGGEHAIVSRTRETGHVFHLCVAYSEFGASSFSDLDVPVKVICGPVDTDAYAPAPGQERDPRLVLALGRLLPHKGFDRIIKALAPPLQLVIAGTASDAEYLDHLRRLIRMSRCEVRIEEGLSDEQVRAWMQRAGLFVHASTHLDYKGRYYAKPELLGLAPLEALACGTPALVSNAGSLAELACLEGCRTFSSDLELAEALRSHAEQPLRAPPPDVIHASVRDRYGMLPFGARFIAELEALGRDR
jgi:glycosyltransferase involved in cell wall biosynthesis